MNDPQRKITEKDFETYLRTFSYFLTFGWIVIIFAIILWLVKYKDVSQNRKRKFDLEMNVDSNRHSDCIFVSI